MSDIWVRRCIIAIIFLFLVMLMAAYHNEEIEDAPVQHMSGS